MLFLGLRISNHFTVNLFISAPEANLCRQITITGSKSESNRLLLLQALFPEVQLENLSNSDDTRVMKAGVHQLKGTVDIHHAGTAMRFLTAYFASANQSDVVLTGSSRMKERPISILVDALRQLGASITYLEKEGYPPLKISGRDLAGGSISLPANISSQYISALLLVAPRLNNGLHLELVGQITSEPYIRMTLSLLEQLGVQYTFEGQTITIAPGQQVRPASFVVESDWSSASYFYSLAALGTGADLHLSSYREHSLQADSALVEIYSHLGVKTEFKNGGIRLLHKENQALPEVLSWDLTHAPDIAQTIAVTCFGLGIGCELTGLHTLKIKETDRLMALKEELGKLGASIRVTEDSLHLDPSGHIRSGVAIDTYNDHRMAMAFAPLALKTSLIINDAEVVSKSYPDFWEDMKFLGMELREEV